MFLLESSSLLHSLLFNYILKIAEKKRMRVTQELMMTKMRTKMVIVNKKGVTMAVTLVQFQKRWMISWKRNQSLPKMIFWL